VLIQTLGIANSQNQKSTAKKRSGALAPGVAFVTGGARGLGNAIAVSFAKEGARGVVIVDINQEQLEEGRKAVEAYGTPVSHPHKLCCESEKADI
jgi:NAD(P)-dependent dehydrogenase (short-subunit alcohol dehydrogenase family)